MAWCDRARARACACTCEVECECAVGRRSGGCYGSTGRGGGLESDMSLQREVLRHWLLIVIVFVLAAIIIHFIAQVPLEDIDFADWERRFQSFGVWAYLFFVSAFVVLAMLPVPSTFWVLLGGSLFGPFTGALLSIVSATIAAALAFLLGRYWARKWVRQRAGVWTCRVIRGIEAENWRFVAMTRLIPIFPFAPTNYALGLTDLRLSTYVLTTGVALIPNLVAYAWLGHATRQALVGAENLIQILLLGLALLALLLFLPGFIRRLSQTDTVASGC